MNARKENTYAILVQIQMQRKMLIQIENVKPVKMVEGLTEVAIDAFPHHCRIEVFAEIENMNKRRLYLSVGFNFFWQGF